MTETQKHKETKTQKTIRLYQIDIKNYLYICRQIDNEKKEDITREPGRRKETKKARRNHVNVLKLTIKRHRHCKATGESYSLRARRCHLWLVNWLGTFLVRDNRVLNGPLSRSLRSFARTAHSAHSLRSAPLRYARFTRLLRSRACSLTSLTPLWYSDIYWYMFTL